MKHRYKRRNGSVLPRATRFVKENINEKGKVFRNFLGHTRCSTH